MKIEGETQRLDAHMADLAGSSFCKSTYPDRGSTT